MTEQEKRDLIRTLCYSQVPDCVACPFCKERRGTGWCYNYSAATLPVEQLDNIISAFRIAALQGKYKFTK